MKARLSLVQSSHHLAKQRPIVCFIPGGPGLSSMSLRSMDLLSRSFDLVYIDPPGTAGLDELPNPTFFSVVDALEAELLSLKRPIVLCGHSFGGLYAVEILSRRRLDVVGFCAIAVPFSNEAYAAATNQFNLHMTPELSAAGNRFDEKPTNENLAQLYGSYGVLYFSADTKKRGNSLLASDLVSAPSFVNILPVISERTPDIQFTDLLRACALRKVMIAGAEDLLLPLEVLRVEAQATQCEFHEVSSAGHFVTFDQPEAVARLIENIFTDSKME